MSARGIKRPIWNSRTADEEIRDTVVNVTICVGFISTSILVMLSLYYFLYGAISVRLPECSIEDFYVPALSKAINTTTPIKTIFFDIKLDNKNKAKGVKYASINLTFYYGSDTSFPIGNYIVPGFYQGLEKNTHRREVVETDGVPWEAAARLVSNGSTVSFHVRLSTTVRLKFWGVLNKKHKMVVGATVDVDDSGEKVAKNGIEFIKSSATSVVEGRYRRGLLELFPVFITLVFMF